MNDDQLLRYSRQILLPEIDIVGQQRLLDARVAIIGLGGLGSPVAMYLAAAGVGGLTLCDFDRVEGSNLQRQILHGEADVGRAKTASATDRVLALNAACQVRLMEQPLDEANLPGVIADCDVVADGSDRFATRFAVNAACQRAGIPLVSAAVARWEGQLSVFDPRDPQCPCYRCLYPDGEDENETCAATGIVAPAAGVVGSLQALEVVKVLLDQSPLRGQLLAWDGKTQEFRTLRLRRDPACPVCA